MKTKKKKKKKWADKKRAHRERGELKLAYLLTLQRSSTPDSHSTPIPPDHEQKEINERKGFPERICRVKMHKLLEMVQFSGLETKKKFLI